MFETSEPSTSKVAKFSTSCSNVEDSDIELDEMEECSTLWCVEDDTLFYARGLKHHSAGKGKSVYVTWNENYLLNFVFKTSSKTGATTLTKVRIAMPINDQQQEEISNMLILEMNTLLYMKSGNVYYFSSVKSMHKIDWLTGIRCLNSCPLTQFSVIRLRCSADHDDHNQKNILCLEVYKDIPQLGKCFRSDVLRNSYDISFDLENLFNCDWSDETYTLTSLISDKTNITFLKQLVSIGNIFRPQEEIIDIKINQEVHIFTISGNLFILVGAIVSEAESISSNSQVEGFGIRLLNTYACPIECIRIDCENNLMIVLLQSGHMDIWYKNKRMLNALFHKQHEISHFLDYDYWPLENTFFFTTPEEIIQLQIAMSKSNADAEDCIVKETRKYVGGMIVCTFVEGLQQLICLSINNIFYRINITTLPETVGNTNGNETKYENINNLYALNLKRVNDLTAKARIIDELMEQPNYLHNAIEKEFRKQQVLALESKMEIFKKLFQCHLEYHVNLPGIEYFDNDCVCIKTASPENLQIGSQTIFCLIFMSLKNNKNHLLSSIFTTTAWYLYISSLEQSLQLYIPYDILNKKLCFIVEINIKQDHIKQVLPKYSLNFLTFFEHQRYPICLKFNLSLNTNDKTYLNLFSYTTQNLSIFRNSYFDVRNLLRKHSNRITPANVTMECEEKVYKHKQYCKIPKAVLMNVMEKLKVVKPSWSLGMDFRSYYLHQYPLELSYDDSKEILLICSNYPVAIFYMKSLLMYAVQSYNDKGITTASVCNTHKMILNYQSDIELLYGSLMSVDSNDESTNTISLHLENLRNVYLKLRIEFNDIFR